jgi:hypothetical protein
MGLGIDDHRRLFRRRVERGFDRLGLGRGRQLPDCRGFSGAIIPFVNESLTSGLPIASTPQKVNEFNSCGSVNEPGGLLDMGLPESDLAIVAKKPANKAEQPAAEASAGASAAEPRAGTKGNADQQSTCRAQNRISVEQALERIRKVARERKKERFTTLFHHISVDLLEEAFYELKENAAPLINTAPVREKKRPASHRQIARRIDDHQSMRWSTLCAIRST